MRRRTLCIATRNAHKLEEIRAVLSDVDLEVRGAAEFPACPEVEEDAPTLEGNAEKKARWVAVCTGLLTLADDTGLEVEALAGAPGVYSARYAGPGCSYSANNARLLRELDGLPAARRAARFRCVMALAEPRAGAQAPVDVDDPRFPHRVAACRVQLFEGRIEGRIDTAPRGRSGFGYDPLFLVPNLGKTLAEFSLVEKNHISHRARALAAARTALIGLMLDDPAAGG